MNAANTQRAAHADRELQSTWSTKGRTMRRFLSRRMVMAAVAAIVIGVGTVGVLTAGRALAAGVGMAAMGFGPWGGYGGGPWGDAAAMMPQELRDLHNLPPAERFKRFTGVQVGLKDANNQPLTIAVTPGTVSAASATSLTLAANDGTTKTYTLTGQTVIRGRPTEGNPNNSPNLSQGDLVVVITHNGATEARAVFDGNKEGFGPMGGPGRFGGPFGPGR